MDGAGRQVTRNDSQLLKSQCSLGNWQGALLIPPTPPRPPGQLALLIARKQVGDHSAGATL